MAYKKSKPPYKPKPFESKGDSWDTSANIYMTMLLSAAYKKLTSKQRDLYTHCKSQYYAEKRKPNDDKECFTMNQSKWWGLYNLYTKTNAKGFQKDMARLIELGFIVCVQCGAVTRTKSIYKFSDMWQKYGTKDFIIKPEQKTLGMIRRENNLAMGKKQ